MRLMKRKTLFCVEMRERQMDKDAYPMDMYTIKERQTCDHF